MAVGWLYKKSQFSAFHVITLSESLTKSALMKTIIPETALSFSVSTATRLLCLRVCIFEVIHPQTFLSDASDFNHGILLRDSFNKWINVMCMAKRKFLLSFTVTGRIRRLTATAIQSSSTNTAKPLS